MTPLCFDPSIIILTYCTIYKKGLQYMPLPEISKDKLEANLEIVRLLLARGANPNLKDKVRLIFYCTVAAARVVYIHIVT